MEVSGLRQLRHLTNMLAKVKTALSPINILKMKVDPAMCMKTNIGRQKVHLI